ncbi:MAG: hypothetical protein DCC46_07470 [Armatimonadetes bacterium]|nr:MAG: hypothetical protein DCC46_07470 [Armatimonadota bacterium]
MLLVRGNGVCFVAALGVSSRHRFAKLRVATLQAAFILGAGFHQGVALRSNPSARWACRITDAHLTKEFGSLGLKGRKPIAKAEGLEPGPPYQIS